MANIFQKLGNMKTRALLVVVLVVVVIAAGLVWLAVRKSGPDLLHGQGSTKQITPGIASLPGGGKPNVVYDPLQVEQNALRAEAALAGTGSAVPSLINQGEEGYGRGGFGNFADQTGRCGDECYDEHGYDKDGFDRHGYNAQGFDKNGFDKDGYNAAGFDKNGFDKNGYDKDGFDRFGFDKDGYDKDGFDRFGYDKDGFDKNGCNRQGFDREGKPCAQALGADCYTPQGLDANGCNREGLGPDGKVCYDKEGFNEAGLDKCGFNKDGFNKDDLDRNHCGKDGKDKNGNVCYDMDGLSAAGIDKFGMDKEGFNKEGFNKDGFDKNGFDKNGYDKDGFDKNGCNSAGLNRQGKPCYDVKGYNDAGFDRQGYDKNGLDANGRDRQGYDKNGYDKDGFDRSGCNREGFDRQGKPCHLAAGTQALAGLGAGAGGGVGPGGVANIDLSKAAATEYERLKAEQAALDAQHYAQLSAEQRAEALNEEQARLAAYESMMSTQAQAILQAWAPPTQSYVRGTAPEIVATTPTSGTGNGLPPTGQGPIVYKAGDMLFAVVDTSINSDEPGPVLARVVSQGPLYGARIMGTFERQDQVLFVRFQVLSLPQIPQSIAMDAVAVDPETARTSVATAVDNHTLEKYGTLLAASFLQGMGEAVETSLGTPNLDNGNGTIIASQVPATTRDQVIVGLGKVGQAIGEDLASRDLQPTVTLDSGTGIGLLIMSDLRIEQPPTTDEHPLRVDAPLAPGEKPAEQPAPTRPIAGAPGQGVIDRRAGMPGGPATSTPLIKAGPPL